MPDSTRLPSDSPSLRLFGTPEIRESGRLVSGIRGKGMAILSFLAVENRPVSRDSLTAMFWPETSEERARGSLRTCIHSIRRSLPSGILQVSGGSLSLRSDVLDVDVRRFRKAARDILGDDVVSGTSGDDVLDDCRQAMSLYGPGFLSGFSLKDCRNFDEWQYLQEESLRHLMNAVLAVGQEIAESRGITEEELEFLRYRTVQEPLDEELRYRLIQILVATGQTSAAIREYRHLEFRLRDELDTGPTASLDYFLDPPETGRQKSPTCARYRVPRPVGVLYGRDRDMEIVSRELSSAATPLTNLVGPPGAGKTSLALKLGSDLVSRYAMGVAFVDLSPLESSADIPIAIADELGIAMTQDPMDPVSTLEHWLIDRDLLIILDNLEHLPGSAGVIDRLIRIPGGPHLLTTSRSVLGLAGEKVIEIRPLDTPVDGEAITLQDAMAFPAVAFFVDRAVSRIPGFRADDADVGSLCRICRRLDGLPLAIELAVPLLMVRDLEDLLEDGSPVVEQLSGGIDGSGEGLEGALERSWRLLDDRERRLLSTLTVFMDGFTRPAVVSVVGDSSRSTEKLLASLIEKNMVSACRSGSGRRFGLLATVHEFAGLKQDTVLPGLDVVRRNHAGYFRNLAARCAPLLWGTGQMAAITRLNEEHSNLLAALDRLTVGENADAACRMAVDLKKFWMQTGRTSTALGRLEALESRIADISPSLRLSVYNALGWFRFVVGDWRIAVGYFEKAWSQRDCVTDPAHTAWFLADLAVVRRWTGTGGEDGNPRDTAEEAIGIARSLESPPLMLHTLISAYATSGGEFDGRDPEPGLREAESLAEDISDEWSLAHARNGLADFFAVTGRIEEARWNYKASEVGFRSVEDRWMLAWTNMGLAAVERREGHREEEEVHLHLAVEYFDAVGDRRHREQARRYLSRIPGPSVSGMRPPPDEDEAMTVPDLLQETGG